MLACPIAQRFDVGQERFAFEFWVAIDFS